MPASLTARHCRDESERAPSFALARSLVMEYGWNATSYQILNPGIDHWFSAAAPAVVGYTRRRNLLVVAGAPVCAPEALPDVCGEFETFACGQRCRVCYVCAEERLHALLASSPDHAAVTLGAQPVWDPHVWQPLVHRHTSLRAQLNRCRNKAVSVQSVDPGKAAACPELKRVLHEWLEARRLPPLRFLVQPEVLNGVVVDRVVLVAARYGVPVAFLVASPIASKNGYLIELVARTPTAPNGVSELLIDAAMRRFAHQGRKYVTLGLVPLATAADGGIRKNPFWLRSLMQFARLHAARFYNFRGLEQFRIKMAPSHWEPVYAISTESRFSASTLYRMGAAFSGIPPWLAIGKGFVNAVRQELPGRAERPRPQ